VAENDDRLLVPLPIGPVDSYGRSRDAEAARLKALGWTLTQIATHLQLWDGGKEENGPSESRAGAAIKRAMARAVRFASDETRALELQSYDELEAICWRELQARHQLVQNGRIIVDLEGLPLLDKRLLMEIVDRIMKIKERRARILGLDAPTKAEILTVDSVDAEIAKLERELAEARKSNLI
jgi:hypothetical protein